MVDVAGASWRDYENLVAKIVESLDEKASIRRNVRRRGVVSGRLRQIDVFAHGTFLRQKIEVLVECKLHSKKIGIGGVDELIGKCLDVGVDHAMLYSAKGFTADALARARGARFPKVTLVESEPEEEASFSQALEDRVVDDRAFSYGTIPASPPESPSTHHIYVDEIDVFFFKNFFLEHY